MDILSMVTNEEIKQIIIDKKDVVNKRMENNECMIDMQLSIRVVYREENAGQVSIIRVGEYLEHWLYDLKRYELKASTFDRKEQVVKNQIIPCLGERDIRLLRTKEIQEMINQVSERYSYSTVKKVYECINACLKNALKEGLIPNNPASMVVLPKRLQDGAKDVRFFLPCEVEKIKKECVRCYQNGNRVYRIGEIVIFLLNTGLRIGEALALEWSDIDFERCRVKVRKNVVYVKKRDKDGKMIGGYQTLRQNTTKIKSGDRIVPLNQEALAALMTVRTINGNYRYVFATQKGKRVHPRNVDRMFRCVLKNCEIQGVGVHTLRHTFASSLFARGVDVKTVSQLLGHSEVGITYDTYIHLIQEQEIEAVRALEKL